MRYSDCKSRKYCDNADKVNYCAGYIFDDSKPKMQTNEEWFCNLSTEEKAKVFANATYSTALAPMEILALDKEFEQKKWEMWLKQPHSGVAE